ncbi:MAG: hypothetical protein DCF19_11460 [Pseudanabaena frigida]|uniref:Diguanylate cyclase n=1 Tax=Pseudanabaena frigida TaxID=945775 RepID=A0A2W4W5W5_9CYAN|nr:MAG: hypothetical protein DCF19_11460 [Pseudanabaena frigida]
MQAHKPLRVPIFAVSDNSDFSFNSSYPIYAPETGQLLGVFSAASDLSFFHKFMTELEIGKTGRVFIVERNGLLVGDSTKNLPFVKIQKDGKTILQRLKATDSRDRLIQLASTYLSNKFNRLENGLEQIQTTLQLEFWEGSDRHFLEVVPYRDDLGLDWLIVFVVPESDFMFKVQDNIYWTVFLCGMTLILSIGLGILVARWISQPILRLSLASDALAQGIWQVPVQADSAIAEIKALSQSFNQMSAQVQQSFDRVEVALKESQEKYKVLYQILPIGISITDKEGRIIESNIISERFLGIPNSVQSTCQQSEINPNIISPDGSPMPIEEYACVKALRSQSSVYDVEMGIVCVDGILRWFSVSATPIHLAQYGVVLVLVDISDRKRAEAQLRENEARFQKISDTSPEAIYILISHVDGSTNFEYASKASEELLGVSVEYLKSRTNIRYELFHPDDLVGYERAMADSLKTLQPFCHEWRIITPQGQIKWLKSQACPEQRDNGDIAWYGFAIDISDRKKSEITLALAESSLRQANQELERLVNLDGLTQIANRRCFNERIVHEWQRLHREQQPLSLLMFDVDYFKRYNDHYGHQMGDTCLVKIAQAVNHLMCRPADLVARYGGEEFIVILPNTDLDGAIAVADRIHIEIQNLQIPHQYSDVSDVVSVSLGIACDIPNIERSPYVLINQSDQALYYAKQKGRNQSVIFAE